MMDNIDEVADKRLAALNAIERDKLRVARAYNKKVKLKNFQVGDLVWKVILPIGSRDRKFRKWSLSWEGPLGLQEWFLKTLIWWNLYKGHCYLELLMEST